MLVAKDYESNKNKLFNGFSDNDIAKILRLHFEYFKRKDIELDTIRKKYIKPVSERFYSSAMDKIRKEIVKIKNRRSKVQNSQNNAAKYRRPDIA